MIKRIVFIFSLVIIVFNVSSGFKANTFKKLEWFHTDKLSLNYHITKPEEIINVKNSIPFTGKTFTGFKEDIGFKESRGNYKCINTFGYMGKYQFGKGTLSTIGIKDSLKFMNTPSLQEEAFETLLSLNKYELQKELKNYVGKTINGVEITESGLLAAAHLGGVGSVKKFLKSNGKRIKTDGYGTSIQNYINKFGGYDTSCIPPIKNARVSK
ncbi:MAG: peptidoglycan-binding protein LysM [Flavobacterium sp.]|jgi:hypothetical protein